MNNTGGLVTKPRVIEKGEFKIVIMDSPDDANAGSYLSELKSLGVTDIVRTCEPTYSSDKFDSQGIRVHEMMFPDGAPPPEDILVQWIDLVQRRFLGKDPSDAGLVAVHCVAGLGRAPVMAAVALIELTNTDPMDAVVMIRDRQKGAINHRQLNFLQAYKKRTTNGGKPCHCSVM